ncbi:hypothetical protein NQ166_04615 [Microbacterium sp. zg.Y1090]|uniref:hypothetical protein n=1 Tax=Microbacterium TaxID=33882 RepID=UPI00214CC58A|nr:MULTISPECIES: hypothetical protein [unclassified Microbacterium]MCR2813548.1 hypothetical protein [Microbacterium sp. zg.Y1084]MCR2818115.1 hypothetical protein [Microbacterium sp. zg.Y1090]MDL5486637.1 hypothetical protein [Microbacterium sp. zg-Y1211]WIM27729.1 hypothetical protein QNO26_11300 [Microbacterium sp. zg-Y1090]
MSAPEIPPARKRAPWADVRFALGVVLIVASVAGVWFVVSASRQTVPVFAAVRTIVPGEAIDAAAVQVVDVALGQVREAYAAPGLLEPDAIATRTITSGELVPLSAVGPASSGDLTSVVLRSTTDVPASVAAGTRVEVWSAPAMERGQFDQPRILVPDATVATVTRDDSVLGSDGAALELIIPRADVAAALAAVAGGAALSVVPLAGGGR